MIRSFLLLTICAGIAYAQDTETNMQCVERLEMPVYPPLAKQARIAGTVTAVVAISSGGAAKTMARGDALLTPAVEGAIRASMFRKACAGKSVTLVFHFVVGDILDKLPQRIAFGYPNQFWITVPGTLAQP